MVAHPSEHDDGHAVGCGARRRQPRPDPGYGARENNLKDVSVQLPKRRLTGFTGASGSGRSSLVLGTTAARAQRLVNETYSASLQGLVPTPARPDVDAQGAPADLVAARSPSPASTSRPTSAPDHLRANREVRLIPRPACRRDGGRCAAYHPSVPLREEK